MATIVLTAAGQFFGGPVGAAIGALIGSKIDGAIFAEDGREGPRLKELDSSTSSYGSAIPRHFGKMRSGGSIIWATELVESSEKTGGGKGRPSTTNFSYAANFAIALSSRPIQSVGRIWADGNLLRGAAGDLKTSGEFRVYLGHGDQSVDPLLAQAEGIACPAFRGIAYCVFENLQLTDFGNRIPALTFEIIADNGEVLLEEIVAPYPRPITIDRPLDGIIGFSDEGGPLIGTLKTLDAFFPFSCNTQQAALSLRAENLPTQAPPILPEAVVDAEEGNFGELAGRTSYRQTEQRKIPAGIRYYDFDREYQLGLQRASGQARSGGNRIVDFPATIVATDAQRLADNLASRAIWSLEKISWRIAEIPEDLLPGDIVRLPDRPGYWRIETWEWRETGLELELVKQAHALATNLATDSGRSLSQLDMLATPTLLQAFELPWDGTGSTDERQIFSAATSQSAAWTGAALYANSSNNLIPLGATGSQRSISGTTLNGLAGMASELIDRTSTLDIQLAADDLALNSATIEDIAQGENRALIGAEIIQFADAEDLGDGRWRLSCLLRGRGGTEAIASIGTTASAPFVLLDARPTRLDGDLVGNAVTISAIGLADEDAVTASISGIGSTRRPLNPVHPFHEYYGDGSLHLCWIRRARGAWIWQGSVEPPIGEQSELYEVGIGSTSTPNLTWQATEQQLTLDAAIVSQLQAEHSGSPIWVRQIGNYDRSTPLLLLTLN